MTYRILAPNLTWKLDSSQASMKAFQHHMPPAPCLSNRRLSTYTAQGAPCMALLRNAIHDEYLVTAHGLLEYLVDDEWYLRDGVRRHLLDFFLLSFLI